MDTKKKAQIICPKCGYKMPLFYAEEAESKGVFVTCKGRKCKSTFEVKIREGKQIVK